MLYSTIIFGMLAVAHASHGHRIVLNSHSDSIEEITHTKLEVGSRAKVKKTRQKGGRTLVEAGQDVTVIQVDANNVRVRDEEGQQFMVPRGNLRPLTNGVKIQKINITLPTFGKIPKTIEKKYDDGTTKHDDKWIVHDYWINCEIDPSQKPEKYLKRKVKNEINLINTQEMTPEAFSLFTNRIVKEMLAYYREKCQTHNYAFRNLDKFWSHSQRWLTHQINVNPGVSRAYLTGDSYKLDRNESKESLKLISRLNNSETIEIRFKNNNRRNHYYACFELLETIVPNRTMNIKFQANELFIGTKVGRAFGRSTRGIFVDACRNENGQQQNKFQTLFKYGYSKITDTDVDIDKNAQDIADLIEAKKRDRDWRFFGNERDNICERDAELEPLLRRTCAGCKTTFDSRNKLFKHLGSNQKCPGRSGPPKRRRLCPIRRRLTLAGMGSLFD